MIPTSGHFDVEPSGINPESAYIERWSNRKARRADEVRRLAQQAREHRTPDAYVARIKAEQQTARKRRATAMRIEAEAKASALALTLQAVALAAVHYPAAPYRAILRETADKHGLAVVDITGRCRKHHIVLARQEAMWRMRMETPFSLPEIGRRMGGKDHTTVLHGIRTHQARLDAAAEVEP